MTHINDVKSAIISLIHPAGFKAVNELVVKSVHTARITTRFEFANPPVNLSSIVNVSAFCTNSSLDVVHQIFVIPGPDSQSQCQTNVTIYATVLGDLTGHTFLWEQIEGTQAGVQYTSPLNETTLTYTNNVPPGTRDDKKFRFWVDKGTSEEQYFDIWSYGAPTDTVYIKSTPVLASNATYTQTDAPTSIVARMTEGTIYDFTTNQNVQGLFLEWEQPINHSATDFIGYTVQKNIGGIWTNQQVLIRDTRFTSHASPVDKNATYRVMAEYRSSADRTQTYKIYSNNAWWIDANTQLNPIIYMPVTKTVFNENTVQASEISNLLAFSTKNQTIPDSTSFNGATITFSEVSDIKVFTTKAFAVSPDDVVSFNGMTANTSINTIAQVTVLTGSVIG